MSHNNSNGRIWLGAILIIVGGLIFLRNFHFNLFYIDILSWPVILLVIGIIILVNHKDSFFGFLLITIGGIGLASRYMGMSFGAIFSEYWPVLLIILGIYTLLKTTGSGKEESYDKIENVDTPLDIFSIFGDKTKIIKTNNFLGGKTTSIFSELRIDLRESKISNKVVELDSLTVFGSTEIYLPNNWEVIIKTTTVFGGFEDQRKKQTEETDSDKQILIVKGLVLFGSGEIKFNSLNNIV